MSPKSTRQIEHANQCSMTKIDDIKSAIEKLPDADVARLREWLAEMDAQRFDEHIERDAAAGKLDHLMEQAKANYAAGKRKEL